MKGIVAKILACTLAGGLAACAPLPNGETCQDEREKGLDIPALY